MTQERRQQQTSGRWGGSQHSTCIAGGYTAMLPSPRSAAVAAPQIPGVISRNFGNPDNTGGNARSWLRPVSSLLQGIPQSKRAGGALMHRRNNVGGGGVGGGGGGDEGVGYPIGYQHQHGEGVASSPPFYDVDQGSRERHHRPDLVVSPSPRVRGFSPPRHNLRQDGRTLGSGNDCHTPTAVTPTAGAAVGISPGPDDRHHTVAPTARGDELYYDEYYRHDTSRQSSSRREDGYHVLPTHQGPADTSTMRSVSNFEQAGAIDRQDHRGRYHRYGSRLVHTRGGDVIEVTGDARGGAGDGGGTSTRHITISGTLAVNDNRHATASAAAAAAAAAVAPPEGQQLHTNKHGAPPTTTTIAAPAIGMVNYSGNHHDPIGNRPPSSRSHAEIMSLNQNSSLGGSSSKCSFEACGKRPTHAQRRGEKPTRCAEHRTGGMVDVVKRNRCQSEGCMKQPRYALPGEKAEYCSQHKRDNYVDVKHPRCESALGCVRQPTFGWEGEKARFCSAHKVDGMLDVKNPRCAEPGCIKRPRYGEEGERARFCAAHKFDHMVDMASRRGSTAGGKGSGSSPSKRPRDGPRSMAHDTAAGAAVGLVGNPSRRSGVASGGVPVTFCLSAEDAEEPPPKRGHTVSAAGGHRRATSESWLDFCPKRLYGTTAVSGRGDGTLNKTLSPSAPPAHAPYHAADGGGSRGRSTTFVKEEGSSSRGMPPLPPFVSNAQAYASSSKMLPPAAPGNSPAAAAAPSRSPKAVFALSPRTNTMPVNDGKTAFHRKQQQQQQQQQHGHRYHQSREGQSCGAAPTSRGSLHQDAVYPEGEDGRQLQQQQQQQQQEGRFGPMDYEASAILLECRTRPVVTPHAAAENKHRTIVA